MVLQVTIDHPLKYVNVLVNIVNVLQQRFLKMNVYVAVRAVIVIVLQTLNPSKTKKINNR